MIIMILHMPLLPWQMPDAAGFHIPGITCGRRERERGKERKWRREGGREERGRRDKIGRG